MSTDVILRGFHHLNHGLNIQLSNNATIATRVRSQECANPQSCVAVGSGPISVGELGHFFAIAVRKLDSYRGLRGGTRLGLSLSPPNPPLPSTLQLGYPFTWIFGRGVVRGADGMSEKLRGADIDMYSEGD